MTTQEKLIRLYEKAEKRLKLLILQKGPFSTAAAYQRSLLRQVQKELKKLKESSAEIVDELAKENYIIGLNDLITEMESQGVDEPELKPKQHPRTRRCTHSTVVTWVTARVDLPRAFISSTGKRQ